MVIDNVVINKLNSLSRCLRRIREEYGGNQLHLFENLTRQDSIILNLQRACEICIDLAMHELRKRKLGVPQSSRDTFELLKDQGVLSTDLCAAMKRMVGFRNIAIHEYRSLNMEIVRSIIEQHLVDFENFAEVISKA